ncbi:hypothetical protein NQ314_007494 [Rhamnusium bicolor]|uniref:PiggyBac transposable element-derived protein domain-containing protein n=1 Tax=Rhamnusium bicolor TaxID=1586634 RepID=A0AAV8YMW9_9CUCU|nr:hypothetical protein NQ314_007494 [Rhamnusium bicolor]
MTELKAFLGLLVYTAIFNLNHENVDRLFATDGTGRDIYKSVMSKKKYSVLFVAIQFDDYETREERKKNDPVVAISFIISTFIENCQSVYGLVQSATVDEMLVSFRGRCKFKMNMANKPKKIRNQNSISYRCAKYLYNAYIYSGKDSDERGLSSEDQKFLLLKPTQAVLRLAAPLFYRNSNIIADNGILRYN